MDVTTFINEYYSQAVRPTEYSYQHIYDLIYDYWNSVVQFPLLDGNYKINRSKKVKDLIEKLDDMGEQREPNHWYCSWGDMSLCCMKKSTEITFHWTHEGKRCCQEVTIPENFDSETVLTAIESIGAILADRDAIAEKIVLQRIAIDRTKDVTGRLLKIFLMEHNLDRDLQVNTDSRSKNLYCEFQDHNGGVAPILAITIRPGSNKKEIQEQLVKAVKNMRSYCEDNSVYFGRTQTELKRRMQKFLNKHPELGV